MIDYLTEPKHSVNKTGDLSVHFYGLKARRFIFHDSATDQVL